MGRGKGGSISRGWRRGQVGRVGGWDDRDRCKMGMRKLQVQRTDAIFVGLLDGNV